MKMQKFLPFHEVLIANINSIAGKMSEDIAISDYCIARPLATTKVPEEHLGAVETALRRKLGMLDESGISFVVGKLKQAQASIGEQRRMYETSKDDMDVGMADPSSAAKASGSDIGRLSAAAS